MSANGRNGCRASRIIERSFIVSNCSYTTGLVGKKLTGYSFLKLVLQGSVWQYLQQKQSPGCFEAINLKSFDYNHLCAVMQAGCTRLWWFHPYRKWAGVCVEQGVHLCYFLYFSHWVWYYSIEGCFCDRLMWMCNSQMKVSGIAVLRLARWWKRKEQWWGCSFTFICSNIFYHHFENVFMPVMSVAFACCNASALSLCILTKAFEEIQGGNT